jgi:hypothetical protein
MLGDEEGYCSSQYPKCRTRMKVERAKSHGRKARCKSAIAERLHADVKLDSIIII